MIRCPLLSSSLTGQSYGLSFLTALAKQALCERFLLFGHLSLPFALYVVTTNDSVAMIKRLHVNIANSRMLPFWSG